jgi:hemolysin-activating ACP:hemolysin acyltransferase
MSQKTLKTLIERARTENKVLYCPGNDQYYTPADLDNLNSKGKCLWAIEHFELKSYDDLAESRNFHVHNKTNSEEKIGIIYFPVAELGDTRVFVSDISFWYYEEKSNQTMIHLQSGECLRVDQPLEIVDQKIMEAREPLIGKELANFWYDIIVNGIHHNGKGIKF